jgi:hypothetical protein
LIDMVLVLFPRLLIHRDNMGAMRSTMHQLTITWLLLRLSQCIQRRINETDKMGRLPIPCRCQLRCRRLYQISCPKSPEGARIR